MSKALEEYLALRQASETATPPECSIGRKDAVPTPQDRLRLVPPGVPWVSRCPAGHLTREFIESHQVLGWVCSACQKVYDTSECRPVRHESGGAEIRVGELE